MNKLRVFGLMAFLLLVSQPAAAHLREFPDEIKSEKPMLGKVPGFSWVEKNLLCAMARPGRERPLEQDLAFLQESGVTILVSLTEETIPAEDLIKFGITGVHLPVEDFTPPTLAQIELFLAEVENARLKGRALGVHCTAGKGRSGTMLASYLVSQGLTAPEALAKIRRLRPGSVETEAQEARVVEFAEGGTQPRD